MFEYENYNDLISEEEQFVSDSSSITYEKTIDKDENNELNKTYDDSLYNASSWKYIKNDSLHDEIFKLKSFLFEELEKVDIELTIKSNIENFVSENYSDEMYVALSEIFTENIDNYDLVIKIIRCLTLIPYKKLNSGAKLLALSALNIKDKMVQQQAVQAFGLWSDPVTIKILSNIECEDKWFKKYILKIIEGIKEDNGI